MADRIKKPWYKSELLTWLTIAVVVPGLYIVAVKPTEAELGLAYFLWILGSDWIWRNLIDSKNEKK